MLTSAVSLCYIFYELFFNVIKTELTNICHLPDHLVSLLKNIPLLPKLTSGPGHLPFEVNLHCAKA